MDNETRPFLNLLYQYAEEGNVTLSMFNPTQIVHISVDQLGRVTDTVRTWSKKGDIYFSHGLRRDGIAKDKRGGIDDVAGVPCFVVDIDIKGPAHKGQELPPTQDDTMELLGAFPLKPSVVVHTGGGLHAYWILKEPWMFDDTDERAKAQQLGRGLQGYFQHKALERGWKIDNVSSLDHVFRLPGTLNHKPVNKGYGAEPVPVKIIEETNMRYSPSDLEPYLPYAVRPLEGFPQRDGEYPESDAERVFERCQWMRHCQDDAKSLSEPEWMDMLRVLARCTNGRERAHKASEPYDGYTEAETDAKFNHAVKYEPASCARIQSEYGAHCGGCSHKVKSPIVLGQANRQRSRPEEDFEALDDGDGAREVVQAFLESASTGNMRYSAIYEEPIIGALAELPDLELLRAKNTLREQYGRDFKVRDFDRAIKSAKRSKGPRLRAVEPTEPALIALEGLTVELLEPAGYSVKPSGVYRLAETEEEGIVHVPIARAPLLMTKVLIDASTGEECCELAWPSRGRWQSHVLSRGDVFSARELVAVARYGAPVASTNTKDLVSYFIEFENANRDRIPTQRVVSSLGWQGKRDFFQLGSRAIGEEDVVYHGDSAAEGYETSGTLDEWKGLVTEAYQYPLVMMMLCASLSAPLLQIVDCPNFLVDLAYMTSSGKSTALRLAASVWGKADERITGSLISSWNTTTVGAERRAGLLNGLPLFLDDSSTVKGKDKGRVIEENIYLLERGVGRTRGAKAGGTQKTERFRTVGISTGEEMLKRYTKQGGASARVLSLQGKPFGGHRPEVVNAINHGTLSQYGTAGSVLVKHILSCRSEWDMLKKEWLRVSDQLSTLVPSGGVASRLADSFALLVVARMVANSALGLEIPDLLPQWQGVAKEGTDADKALVALEQVIGWSQANELQFKAFDRDKPAGGSGWAGVWEESETIHFYKHRLHDILETFGHNPEATISQWAERGWLDVGKGRMTDKRVRVDGKLTWAYVLTDRAMTSVIES